jgi:hypothetical protein
MSITIPMFTGFGYGLVLLLVLLVVIAVKWIIGIVL